MTINIEAETVWLVDWISKRHPNSPAIAADAEFVESGLLDSFGVIELIAAAESKFDMRFTEDDFADPAFNTVRGFLELIDKRKSAQ